MNKHKKVLEALGALSTAYREVAQNAMEVDGSVYDVYYAMRDSIAVENKARNYSRRWPQAVDNSPAY